MDKTAKCCKSYEKKMKSCAFFGHRNIDAKQYREKLLHIITDLIENKGVTKFYSDFRGDFNRFCSDLICELKALYPNIQNVMVLSYIPDNEFDLPTCFDGSVYLLERRVPQRLAIIETNKCLVEIADYVIAGVIIHGGGAYSACEYAFKRKESIISVIDGWEI